jgi:hypothetical protein
MSPLGRGLASLIPPRSEGEIKEAFEHIETMEPAEMPPEKPKVTYLDPNMLRPKRTSLSVQQIADNEPDMPLVRKSEIRSTKSEIEEEEKEKEY